MSGQPKLNGAGNSKKAEEKSQRRRNVLLKILRLDLYIINNESEAFKKPKNTDKVPVQKFNDNVEVKNFEMLEKSVRLKIR